MSAVVLELDGINDDFPLRESDDVRSQFKELETYLRSLVLGVRPGDGLTVRKAADGSSATVTLATCAAGNAVWINGVPFVARSGSDLGPAQVDVFSIGGSDTQDATALKNAINNSTTPGIAGVVTATSNSNAVTISSVARGRVANALTVETKGILASGTLTCVSAVDTDTVVIGGNTLTVVDEDPGIDEVLVGATDAEMASNLATAINGHATIGALVAALVVSNVVTLYSRIPGLLGNCITLSTTGGTITASVTRLAGATIATHEGVQASATITITGADGGTYRATINGQNIDVTGTNGQDNTTAATLCTAILASTNALVRGVVEATVSTNVVTVKAVRGGTQGNQVTLTASGTGAVATGSGRLASGAAPTTVVPSAARLSGGDNDDEVSYTLGAA